MDAPSLFSEQWWGAFFLSPVFAAALMLLAALIVTWVVWLRLRWDKQEAQRRHAHPVDGERPADS